MNKRSWQEQKQPRRKLFLAGIKHLSCKTIIREEIDFWRRCRETVGSLAGSSMVLEKCRSDFLSLWLQRSWELQQLHHVWSQHHTAFSVESQNLNKPSWMANCRVSPYMNPSKTMGYVGLSSRPRLAWVHVICLSHEEWLGEVMMDAAAATKSWPDAFIIWR